jgi:galactokinase
VARQAIAFAPGRVNLIGEHTDYNGGLALPFAIAEGVTVRASALRGRTIDALATDLGEHDRFAVDSCDRADGWRAFARGVVAELRRAGVELPGARLEVAGTVPRGAGLSSSAALEVALTLALLAIGGGPTFDRLELARLCSRVENEWVGARTGLLDQLASLFGEPRHALLIDFRSLDVRPVPLDLDGCTLVTVDSGERHANVSSGYNRRREECAEACAALGVPSLREATLEGAERLPGALSRRARHVIGEDARVLEMVSALERGDLGEAGRLLDASHASLRDLYEVSTPAVEAAVARLRAAGALGARVVGGGFGGHVLGLLPADAALPADAHVVTPGPGAALR